MKKRNIIFSIFSIIMGILMNKTETSRNGGITTISNLSNKTIVIQKCKFYH